MFLQLTDAAVTASFLLLTKWVRLTHRDTTEASKSTSVYTTEAQTQR